MPLEAALSARSNAAFAELVYGGTLAGEGLSWTSVHDDSATEYNLNATGITGGISAPLFFAPAGTGQTRGAGATGLLSRLPLALDIDGANPINLSIVVTSFSGTANVSGALNWREIY